MNNIQGRTWKLRWRSPAYCVSLLEAAIEASNEHDSRLPLLHHNLAWLHRWSGQFDKADQSAAFALNAFSNAQNKTAIAQMLAVHAIVTYSRGDHLTSLKTVDEGIRVLGKASECESMIDLLVTASTLYQYSGDLEKGRSFLEDSLELATRLDLTFEPARIHHNMARLELRAQNVSDAIRLSRSSLELAERVRNRLIMPYCHEIYAMALVAAGSYQDAIRSVNQGLKGAADTQDLRVTCQLYQIAGNCHLEHGDYEKAKLAFSTGLQFANEVKYPLWQKNFHRLLSTYYESIGDHEAALNEHKLYADLHDKIFFQENSHLSAKLRNQLDYKLVLREAETERQLRRQMELLNSELTETNQSLQSALAQIEHHALHDPLTDLANRRQLATFFKELENRGPAEHSPVAGLLIDLDGFKSVNDTHGHDVGDATLKVVAERLRHVVQPGEILARVGGDEFFFASIERTRFGDLKALAEEIIEVVKRPITIEGKSFQLGASIGVSVQKSEGDFEKTLLRQSDEAMYAAKRSGANTWTLAPSAETSAGR